MRLWTASGFAVGLALFAWDSSGADSPPSPVEACQRCHGDAECKDEKTGKPCALISSAALLRSEHRGMLCGDCHAKSYETMPHPAAHHADCLDCHAVNEPGAGVPFRNIADGFARSIHAEKVKSFRCSDCHDAHTFVLATSRDHTFNHNVICLRCHRSPEVFRQFVDKAPPDIDKAHAWLPNREMHWSRIRCIDCHTGYNAPDLSHLIVEKGQAVRKCESCHSAEPVSLLRLYSRMRTREVRQIGFLKSAFVNDTYVVGATRNRMMDLFAILLIGATLAGILGHGALRLLAAALRRRSAPPHKESHS